MSEARAIIEVLIEEGNAARAHFQVWWALRNVAIPRFLPTMNNLEYVDFFHASNAGHYKLFLLALSKIFDRDTRVSGIRELRRALKQEGRNDLAMYIGKELNPFRKHISAIMGIRSQSLVHNERALPRTKVYQINGVTPNQIRSLIDKTAKAINYVARELGITNTIFESDRAERATIRMLKKLQRGSI
ncbi:MAG: hypothetical protein ABSG44_03855 [Thermodesulfobacteriota bacterium]|jgi:hypothetical protein